MKHWPHPPLYFPALKLNPFYPSLPTTLVLEIPTLRHSRSSLGSGVAPDARAPGAQRMVPRAAMDGAWAKCSVGRKGGPGCCHVTLKL